MTNEELCRAIQDGDESLITALWLQLERYTQVLAYRWAVCLGYELQTEYYCLQDDFCQLAFFALLTAVKTYSEERASFAHYYAIVFKRTIMREYGIDKYSSGLSKEALSAYKRFMHPTSLDAPLVDDEGNESSLTDIIPVYDIDLAAVDERIFNAELRSKLETAIDKLKPTEAQAIRATFFEGVPMTAQARELGVSNTLIQQRKKKGLRELAKNEQLKNIYRDSDVYSAAIKSSGLQAFKHSGSSTERIAIAMAQGKPINGVYPRRRY